MATEVTAEPLGEIRTISTAGGGTALTTTAGFLTLLPGTNSLWMVPRNFSTAVVAKFSLNPFLAVVKTTDALVAQANLTDASEAVQDAGLLATTTLSMNAFSTAANNDYLYVGAHVPFRGVRVTVSAANAAASGTLTVKYWNGSAWTDITATDGTNAGTRTFEQTGNVYWTVPTAWKNDSLVGIGDTTLKAPNLLMASLYWTRWETSVVFSATVTVTEMQAMNRNTAQYAELLSGQAFEEAVQRKVGGIGCIEALTDAGTANLIVNVAARGSGGRFAP